VRATGSFDGNCGETEGAFPGGELSRGNLLFPLHAVDALDYQEHGKGYDGKADDGVDEDPQVEGDGPSGLGCGQGGIGSGGFAAFF